MTNIAKACGLDPAGAPQQPRFPFDELDRLGEPYRRVASCRRVFHLEWARRLAVQGDAKAAAAVRLVEEYDTASDWWRRAFVEWTRTARQATDDQTGGRRWNR